MYNGKVKGFERIVMFNAKVWEVHSSCKCVGLFCLVSWFFISAKKCFISTLRHHQHNEETDYALKEGTSLKETIESVD